jgi:DNA-3-methyladenine glycosylase I
MAEPPGLVIADGRTGCWWPGADAEYRRYHDEEWGRPVTDDIRLFEKLCLEGFQAGLSWLTILRKRPAFRAAFAGFDPAAVAAVGPDDEARLMADAGIVRNRAKIAAAIHNAGRALELIAAEGSLAAYLWRFEPPPEERPARLDRATLLQLAETSRSRALSKDLKRRGWRFVGPTTLNALLLALGLDTAHVAGGWARAEAAPARAALVRPRSAL